MICLLPVLLVGCLLAVLAEAAPAAPASHSIQKRQGTTVSKFDPSTGTTVPVLLQYLLHIFVSLSKSGKKALDVGSVLIVENDGGCYGGEISTHEL